MIQLVLAPLAGELSVVSALNDFADERNDAFVSTETKTFTCEIFFYEKQVFA